MWYDTKLKQKAKNNKNFLAIILPGAPASFNELIPLPGNFFYNMKGQNGEEK